MNLANPSLLNLNDQQRKTLIDSIRCGECILVLGPYANLAEDGRPQRSLLANTLAGKLPTAIPIEEQEKSSFSSVVCRVLLDSQYNKDDILKTIKDFYKPPRPKVQPNSPYDSIIKLGFRTIFTTDPDSGLIKEFDRRNRNPLGLYFTQVPQPDIVPFIEPMDGITEETPVILNLFGLTDRLESLAIGPEAELGQVFALSSGEIGNKINLLIAPRLAACRWYLFVGFNFRSSGLGSIFYFFSKLTEKVRESRFFGLHSKPEVELTDSTVVYYRNLIPKESSRDNVRIVHSDAQTFFNELNALAAQFPPPPPPASRYAFVVFHPKDRDVVESIRKELEAKLEEYDLTVAYNFRLDTFDAELTEEQITRHILDDEVVLYLMSTNWDDFLFDNYLPLAQQRNQANGVRGFRLDEYNVYGANRQLKPAFDDGSIKLLNRQRPLNASPTEVTSFIREMDAFLEDNLATA